MSKPTTHTAETYRAVDETSPAPKLADKRVVDLGVSGVGVHPVGGFGVPHAGCDCGTCQDARARQAVRPSGSAEEAARRYLDSIEGHLSPVAHAAQHFAEFAARAVAMATARDHDPTNPFAALETSVPEYSGGPNMIELSAAALAVANDLSKDAGGMLGPSKYDVARALDAFAERAVAVERVRLLKDDDVAIKAMTDAIWFCDEESAWDCIARDDCWKAAKAALAALRAIREAEGPPPSEHDDIGGCDRPDSA